MAPVTKKQTAIVYFGVSGHRKGLVDALSGFGVKQPRRFIQNDFFRSAAEIFKKTVKRLYSTFVQIFK